MVLLKNYLGNSEEKNINHEIEDFIYPEIIVYLTNEILKNINLELISQEEVDKKYLEGLGQYFRLKIPKIISMDGISNVEKYLYYYSSYYSSNNKGFKPKIKVLFDNDNAGRKQFN